MTRAKAGPVTVAEWPFKQLSYSYPTSEHAVKHGHGKTGCFCVDVLVADGLFAKSRTVEIHVKKEDALKAALALPQAWTTAYKRYHPDDVA